MITDYIGGEGSAETPKNDYVIYGWPLIDKKEGGWEGLKMLPYTALFSQVKNNRGHFLSSHLFTLS